MSKSKTIFDNVEEPAWIPAWIKVFKENYNFPASTNFPRCPCGQAMMRFKALTDQFIHDMEANDPDALYVLRKEGFAKFYRGLPPFDHWVNFHNWAQEAMCLHPLDRTPAQQSFIVSSQILHHPTTSERVKAHQHLMEKWNSETLAKETLFDDPENENNPLLNETTNRMESTIVGIQTCSLCEHHSLSKRHTADEPQRYPCGHGFCPSCLHTYLQDRAGQRYSCPKCTKCLVCGQYCSLHIVPIQSIKPKPFLETLHELGGRSFDPLKKWDAAGVRDARIKSKPVRVIMAGLEAKMEEVRRDDGKPVHDLQEQIDEESVKARELLGMSTKGKKGRR